MEFDPLGPGLEFDPLGLGLLLEEPEPMAQTTLGMAPPGVYDDLDDLTEQDIVDGLHEVANRGVGGIPPGLGLAPAAAPRKRKRGVYKAKGRSPNQNLGRCGAVRAPLAKRQRTY